VAAGDKGVIHRTGRFFAEYARRLVPRDQSLKNIVAIAVIEVVQIRKEPVAVPIGHAPGDLDDTVGVFERQRLQHKRVEDSEQRGVNADAERQRQHGNQREARFLRQRSRAKAQVLPQCPHNSPQGVRFQVSGFRLESAVSFFS
jgi:hypothetical protein